jgi:hypothetical protein
MTDLNVHWKGDVVPALLFETARAPFVVKNPMAGKPGGGPVQLEVPWREGTAVRSATHSDLLLLLFPLQRLPDVEFLSGQLTIQQEPQRPSQPLQPPYWELILTMYFSPKNNERIVVPFHKCSASIELPGCVSRMELPDFEMRPPKTIMGSGTVTDQTTRDVILSLTINSTHTELVIDGPGLVRLRAAGEVTTMPDAAGGPVAEVSVTMLPVGAESPIQIVEKVARQEVPAKHSMSMNYALALWYKNHLQADWYLY